MARDKARGDVAVHGLWEKGKIFILDIRITDTDAKTYAGSSSVKVLKKAAKVKKDKYEVACIVDDGYLPPRSTWWMGWHARRR